MAEKTPNISRAELFKHGKQLGKRALELLLYHSPDIDVIQPPIEPIEDADPETTALVEKMKAALPLEGGEVNDTHAYHYFLAQSTLGNTLDEHYNTDSSNEANAHQERSLQQAQALALFYSKDQEYPLPVAFNDTFLLTHSLDESRDLAIRDSDGPHAESWRELHATTKELIAAPADSEAYDKHALLRTAFELSDESGNLVMDEFHKLSRVEFIVQGVVNEMAVKPSADPAALLDKRLDDAEAAGLPIASRDKLHAELKQQVPAPIELKRSV